MARTANVGRLSISLDANTIRYINNIKKAQDVTNKRLDKMSASFRKFKKSSSSSISGVVGKIAALGAAYLSLDFAIQTFNTQRDLMDQLAKTADALGINQERLQALHHVGELNGVTVTQMNLSLQRMQRNLGDAAKGTGKAADSLHQMGINIDEISSMRPDEQMDLLAKKLTDVERQTDKAKMAQDLFGRNGVRVLKVLEALKSEGIEPTAKALYDMGVALKRADTEKVEKANDSIFKVTEVLKGMANRVIIRIAPMLEEFANHITNTAKASSGFREEFESTFTFLYRAIKTLSGLISGLWNIIQISFHGWESIINGIRWAAEDWGVDIAELAMAVKYGLSNAADSISNAWTVMFSNIKIKANEWLKSMGQLIQKVPYMEDLGKSMIKSSEEGSRVAKKAIDDAAKRQKVVDEERKRRQAIFDEARSNVQTAYLNRQTVINEKIAGQQKDLMSSFEIFKNGIFGDVPTNSTDESKEDPNKKELDETKTHYNNLLEAYADYDERLRKLRDESNIDSVGRMMQDLDNFDSALGGKLDLYQKYVKAEAAVSSVQAAMQVWSDQSLSFYEKIPASVAAMSAVAQLAGQFHGGVDEVPGSMNNKSFMLKAGERVVQPEANKKLTKFLDSANDGGGVGGNVVINNTTNMGPSLVDEKIMANALSKQQTVLAALVSKERNKRQSRK